MKVVMGVMSFLLIFGGVFGFGVFTARLYDDIQRNRRERQRLSDYPNLERFIREHRSEIDEAKARRLRDHY